MDITGIHETDKSTIYGSLNHIFNVLQYTFTGAKVLCILQPANYASNVSDIDTDSYAQEIGFENLAELQVLDDIQFSNYVHAVKENVVKTSAWWYGVPLLDMFFDFPQIILIYLH